jgi:uncharacterized membrane protein YphA (DoxX/SURF4 family)
MRKWILVALRVLMATVFLYSAYTKLSQSYLIFAMSVDAYQLLPEWAVLAVARTLPPFELVVGLLLLVGRMPRFAAASATLLLAAFFSILVYSYGRGMTIDCGCFGVGEALSPKTLARDGAMLAASIALMVLSFRRFSADGVPGRSPVGASLHRS